MPAIEEKIKKLESMIEKQGKLIAKMMEMVNEMTMAHFLQNTNKKEGRKEGRN